MYIPAEDREEAFILSILDDVVQDNIIQGDTESFLDALSYDGYHSVYGESINSLNALRVAVGTGDTDTVGAIIIKYVTEYTRGVAYAAIKDDLARYGYESTREATPYDFN